MTRTKNPAEYNRLLKIYNRITSGYSDRFRGCLPPPPPTPKIILEPTEKSCHEGYKLGESQGRNWAILISRNKGTYNAGLNRMKCLTGFLRKKNNIFNKCAIRGAKEGYKKFWKLARNPKKLSEYQHSIELIAEAKARQSIYYENIESHLM